MTTLDFPRARKATHYSQYNAKRASYYELLTRFIKICHKGKSLDQITLKTPSMKLGQKLERVIKRHREEAKVTIILCKVEFNISPSVRIKYIRSSVDHYRFDSVEEYLNVLKQDLLEQVADDQIDVVVVCTGNANVGISILKHILDYHPFAFILKLIPSSIIIGGEFVLIDDQSIDYDIKWDNNQQPTIQPVV